MHARVLAARARRGRDPAGALPAPGAGRGARAHPALRASAAAPRRWSSAARCPPDQYARDAGAVPGGRLPGPGEVRLPQRRRRRGGAGRPASGRTVFCLYPHQTRYVVPAEAVVVGAGRRAARAGRARRHGRDRRQRALGRRARWSATGSPSSAPAWSAAASPGCSRGIPGVEVTLVDVDPARADRRGRARRRVRAPADAGRRRPRPRRAHQRDVRRAAALARPARAGGHRARPQLVRRPRGRGCRSAAPSTPAGWRIRASQVGAVAPARRGAPHARATGWRSRSTCCATRPSTRCSPASRRFDELPDVMARLADGDLPAICHTITYGEE